MQFNRSDYEIENDDMTTEPAPVDTQDFKRLRISPYARLNASAHQRPLQAASRRLSHQRPLLPPRPPRPPAVSRLSPHPLQSSSASRQPPPLSSSLVRAARLLAEEGKKGACGQHGKRRERATWGRMRKYEGRMGKCETCRRSPLRIRRAVRCVSRRARRRSPGAAPQYGPSGATRDGQMACDK